MGSVLCSVVCLLGIVTAAGAQFHWDRTKHDPGICTESGGEFDGVTEKEFYYVPKNLSPLKELHIRHNLKVECLACFIFVIF